MPKMVCESLDLMGDVRNRNKQPNSYSLRSTAKTQETDQVVATSMAFAWTQPVITMNAALKNVIIPSNPKNISFIFDRGTKHGT